MKEIKLKSKKYPGKIALVDDHDYEYLSQFQWFLAKYRIYYYAIRDHKINGEYAQLKMHREILGIRNPKILVDHEDHDGLNNQKNNLRVATSSQNSANRSSKKNSSSKYLGVCWDKSRDRWKVSIKKNGTRILLGYFKNEDDAAISYNNAAKIYHGHFANLNVV